MSAKIFCSCDSYHRTMMLREFGSHFCIDQATCTQSQSAVHFLVDWIAQLWKIPCRIFLFLATVPAICGPDSHNFRMTVSCVVTFGPKTDVRPFLPVSNRWWYKCNRSLQQGVWSNIHCEISGTANTPGIEFQTRDTQYLPVPMTWFHLALIFATQEVLSQVCLQFSNWETLVTPSGVIVSPTPFMAPQGAFSRVLSPSPGKPCSNSIHFE